MQNRRQTKINNRKQMRTNNILYHYEEEKKIIIQVKIIGKQHFTDGYLNAGKMKQLKRYHKKWREMSIQLIQQMIWKVK